MAALPHELIPSHVISHSKLGEHLSVESMHASVSRQFMTQGRVPSQAHTVPTPEHAMVCGSMGALVGRNVGDKVGVAVGCVGIFVGDVVGLGVFGLGTPETSHIPVHAKAAAVSIPENFMSSQSVRETQSMEQSPDPHVKDEDLHASFPSQSRWTSVAPLPLMRVSVHTVFPPQ